MTSHPIDDDAGLVERLRVDLYSEGVKQSTLFDAATRIEALSAEVERLRGFWMGEANLRRAAESRLSSIEAETRADTFDAAANVIESYSADALGRNLALEYCRNIAAAIRSKEG